MQQVFHAENRAAVGKKDMITTIQAPVEETKYAGTCFQDSGHSPRREELASTSQDSNADT
jgi:hypothetical protein